MNKRKIEFDYNTVLNSENSPQGSPERNMLMSLLERAILDYVGNNQKEVDSAKSWIFETSEGKDYENQTFSSEGICFVRTGSSDCLSLAAGIRAGRA